MIEQLFGCLGVSRRDAGSHSVLTFGCSEKNLALGSLSASPTDFLKRPLRVEPVEGSTPPWPPSRSWVRAPLPSTACHLRPGMGDLVLAAH